MLNPRFGDSAPARRRVPVVVRRGKTTKRAALDVKIRSW